MKSLRGGVFDVFGYSAHRRLERSLPDWYKDLLRQAVGLRHAGNAKLVLDLACLPDQIRGYEQIKEESIDQSETACRRNAPRDETLLQVTQTV